MAFESKLAKSSKSTDFRISPALCTMFNVMVDAKDQSAKLCAMEMGQEVQQTWPMAAAFERLLTAVVMSVVSTETIPLSNR